MSLPYLILPVALALLLSSIIRQISGFGFALLSMPLITFIAGIRVATPLVALTAVVIGLLVVVPSWRDADRRALTGLLLASVVGIPVGVLLVGRMPDEWVKRSLGAFLILFCVYSFIMPELPTVNEGWATWLFGSISGVLTGAFNTGGPPVVIYGTLRRWEPKSFRATLQLYFLFTSILAMTGHWLAGLWTWQVWQLFLYTLPALLAGLYFGEKINLMIPKRLFNRIIYTMLIVTGLLFFV